MRRESQIVFLKDSTAQSATVDDVTADAVSVATITRDGLIQLESPSQIDVVYPLAPPVPVFEIATGD